MSEAIARVGHWTFKLERDPLSHFEVWEFRCQLCQYKTRHKVTNGTGYVLPLTGNLKERRRLHDRENHPDTLAEQAKVERNMMKKR